MLLQRVTLRDFRNFEQASIELGPRFTVLWGHNGAGKTNVLEAIYLVSTLRSFRTSDLGALVRHGAEAASVELRAFDDAVGIDSDLEVRLERRGNSTRRTARADGKTVRSAAQFYGRVVAILFTPEDLAVLRGSPSGRRQFLDRMLFARERAHIGDVQSYEKLVRSRNHVLKRDDLSAAQRDGLLESYEAGLAETGARIWQRRAELVAELSEPFAEAFAGIHGQVGSSPDGRDIPAMHAAVRYRARLDPDGELEVSGREARTETLAQALVSRRGEDLRRGMTTVGPHRDDLEVELDGQPAATYASQGQSRALVLALKLAELRAAHRARGVPPLLLLDDVSSELDPRRTALLFSTLAQDAGQCVLTTTAAHFIELPATVDACTHRVERGRIELDSEA